MTTPAPTPPTSSSWLRAVPMLLLNALRGGLIGLAELLPGISGGTIALITGVYERLIDAASGIVSAFKRLLFGPDRASGFAAELRRVDWMLVVPVIVGMGAMVVSLAGVIEGLVSGSPELSRGLFFGLVAASIAVPLMLIPRGPHRVRDHVAGVAVFVVAAVAAFLSVAFAAGAVEVDPPLWVVFFAAMIAVCALVLPGVSGSFFLLAVGLYSPTLLAVSERNLAYLGVFALGALVGLVTIVRVMKWMLDHHRRLTLLAMAGLMLGSLRALWPWQTLPAGEDHGVGELAAPYDPIAGPILLAVLGAAIVVVLVMVERALQRRGADIEVYAEEPPAATTALAWVDVEPAAKAAADGPEPEAASVAEPARVPAADTASVSEAAAPAVPLTRAELRRSARAQNTPT